MFASRKKQERKTARSTANALAAFKEQPRLEEVSQYTVELAIQIGKSVIKEKRGGVPTAQEQILLHSLLNRFHREFPFLCVREQRACANNFLPRCPPAANFQPKEDSESARREERIEWSGECRWNTRSNPTNRSQRRPPWTIRRWSRAAVAVGAAPPRRAGVVRMWPIYRRSDCLRPTRHSNWCPRIRTAWRRSGTDCVPTTITTTHWASTTTSRAYHHPPSCHRVSPAWADRSGSPLPCYASSTSSTTWIALRSQVSPVIPLWVSYGIPYVFWGACCRSR